MRLLRQPAPATSTRPIALPRPDGSEWTFLLSPLPLGFHRRLHRRGLIPPLPPLKVSRDVSGKPLRDAGGLAVMLADDRDPDFQQQRDLYHQRVAILAIAESLRLDNSVEFIAQPPPPHLEQEEAWIRYADALFEEMAAAGFSDGDLIRLCDEICRLSNLLDDHLSRARQNFSSPAQPNSG